MTEIIAVDIGGTHVRFARCKIDAGRVVSLGDPVTLKTAEYPSFEDAWGAFARQDGRPLPSGAAIAFAGPVTGELLKLTNNPWEIRPATLPASLGLARCTVINDFGAVAHAVAQLPARHFRHLGGQETQLPEQGVISVIGPGTGLGVSMLLRDGSDYRVVETEGGHIDFAPRDSIEDAILRQLRSRHGRVSVERIVVGTGLVNIHEALCTIEGQTVEGRDEKELWSAALAGEDRLAAAALDRLCSCLGGVAGDIALAQGAAGVVIAGGLGYRLADYLPRSSFHDRFVAKGRFERRMKMLPVKLITHPQPGLYGAAAAFTAEFD